MIKRFWYLINNEGNGYFIHLLDGIDHKKEKHLCIDTPLQVAIFLIKLQQIIDYHMKHHSTILGIIHQHQCKQTKECQCLLLMLLMLQSMISTSN